MSKSKVIQKIKSIWPWRKHVEPPPPEAVAEFLLKYDDLIVGKLTAKRGKWHFEYSVEFKKNKKLRPILELPDIEKHYESPILWQFFAMRIPSLEQPEIEEILSKESIDEHNSVKLLERFGRRTIANPYDLELVS